jgi:hypothetical protein
MEGQYSAPAHGCNDACELGELVHVVGSAARRKRVVGRLYVVREEQNLHEILCCNHEPSLIDLESEHAEADLIRQHRHR